MARSTKFNILAGVGAMALVSAMVMQMSSAAFTGSTGNAGNSIAAGTVSLSDSKAGTAMFSVADMRPGDTASTSCIDVTYTGSLTPSEALDLAVTVGGTGLATDLAMTIQIGTQVADCSLFVADLVGGTLFTGKLSAFTTAISTGWTPAQDAVKTFKFTAALPLAAPNSAQGKTATAAFTWSATS